MESNELKNDNKIYFCIYKIINNIDGKTYIGKHKYKNIDNPLYQYNGSGTLLKKAYKKYGLENFSKEILVEKIESLEEINDLEKQYIKLEKENGHAEYNIAEGGDGGDYGEDSNLKRTLSLISFYKKHDSVTKGKPKSEEFKLKCSQAHQNEKKPWLSNRPRTEKENELLCKLHEKTRGSNWYNNGFIEIHSKEKPEGFEKGRLSKGKKRNKPSGTKGKHWYTNGIENIVAEEAPPNFYPGKTLKKPMKRIKKSNATKGKKHFTDGVHNFVGDICPEGYHPGWTSKKHKSTLDKHRFTDGVHNIWAYECPEGFQPGWIQEIIKMKWITNGVINKKIKLEEDIPEGFYRGKSQKRNLPN